MESKMHVKDFRKFMNELNNKLESIRFLKDQFQSADRSCDEVLLLNQGPDGRAEKFVNDYLLGAYDALTAEVGELNEMLKYGRDYFVNENV